MKKCILRFLTFIFVCFIYSSVQAVSLEIGQEFYKRDFGEIKCAGLGYNQNIDVKAHKYEFTHPSFNGSISGYCIDPNANGASPLTINGIFGGGSHSEYGDKFDNGILGILKNGYSQYNTSFTFNNNGQVITLSGNELILATSIAVRTYSLGLFNYGRNVDGDVRYLTSAYINLGVSWSAIFQENASNIIGDCKPSNVNEKDALKCFKNRASSKYGSWYDKDVQFYYGDKDSLSYKIIYTAQELFRLGLIAANNKDVDSGTSTIKVSETSSTKIENTEKKIITFNIKGLVESGKVNKVNITCDDCAKKGISIGAIEYLSGTEWKQINPDVDLSKHLDKNSNAHIRFLISKNSYEECIPANYKLNYQVIDINSDFKGVLLLNKFYPTTTQRYLALVKTDNTSDRTFNGSINCDTNACETKITTPVCSDEKDGISSIIAPDKITKCILNNKDEADNSYKLLSENGGVDNNYCEVYCKEDYAAISLNKAISNVNCGGYFKLRANIKGSKDCYTSSSKTDKSINKEKFVKDISAAEIDMINAYNKIKMYEEASRKGYTVLSGTCESCTDKKDTFYAYMLSGSYIGKSVIFNHNGEPTIKNETYFYNFDSYGSAGVCRYEPCEKNKKEKCCKSCSGCFSGSKVDFEKQLRIAKNELFIAQQSYNKIIRQYNSCTTGWSNNFKFNQTISYYYDQNNYYGLISNPNDTILEGINGSLKNEETIQVCKGDINDKYECLTNFNNINTTKTELDNNNYSPLYSDVFSSKQYIYCDANKCDFKNVYISNATYVKKSVKKEKDYITPTVFYQIYPTGKITVNGEYNGSALQLSPLINKLPVSSKDTGSGVFKLLIANLGEFYQSDALGRLIDFNGDNEKKSVAYVQKQSDQTKFNGEYVCYYYSSCTPNPPINCPDCVFRCEGDLCEWVPVCTDHCVVVCINCLFNLDELQLNFKTISTNNINSANREFGYNWNINTTLNSLSLIADKAETTIGEIVKDNDKIYNDKASDDDTSLAFSITMTPAVTTYIKEYNKKIDDKKIGGYADDSLTCYDYTAEDGKVYDNIFCYSNFIDSLFDKFGSNEELLKSSKRNNALESRKTNPNSSKYWTPWKNYNYDESIIGGPSWK